MDSEIRGKFQLAIVGAGAAGINAALAAYAAGIDSIIILEKDELPGGVLRQCIHPGFYGEKLEKTGPEYTCMLLTKLSQTNIKCVCGAFVTKISDDRTVEYVCPDGNIKINAQCVILASGCREIPTEALGISGSRPAGVFTAGQVQRMINIRGYDVGSPAVILGAGDIGLIVARRLSLCGKKPAAVIEKKSFCTALPKNQMQCLREFGIPLITNSTVVKIHGSRRISAVTVKNFETGREFVLPCASLISAVGLTPDDELYIDKPWMFKCGNAQKVYQNINQIEISARQTAEAAAEYIQTGRRSALQLIEENYEPKLLENNQTACLVCHRGCVMQLDKNGEVTGAGCNKGWAFFHQNDGRRFFSFSVKTGNGERLLPVRTAVPVSRTDAEIIWKWACSYIASDGVEPGQILAQVNGINITACSYTEKKVE